MSRVPAVPAAISSIDAASSLTDEESSSPDVAIDVACCAVLRSDSATSVAVTIAPFHQSGLRFAAARERRVILRDVVRGAGNPAGFGEQSVAAVRGAIGFREWEAHVCISVMRAARGLRLKQRFGASVPRNSSGNVEDEE
jgi:hypothetical protein